MSQARQIYQLQARAPGFADDAAVWDALASRDDTVIIKPSLLRPRTTVFGDMFADEGARNRRQRIEPGADNSDQVVTGEFGDNNPGDVGSTFRLDNLVVQGGQIPELYLELTTIGQDGVTRNHRVQVIGVLADEDNLAPAELIGSEATLAKLRSVPVTGDELFVKTIEGANPQDVAAKIEGTFVASGLNASVIADEYAQRQRLTGGALQLLQGFMALGLLVGIAALGVISVRSVIERRQQIGMLRALGFQSGNGRAVVCDRVQLCLDHRAADRRVDRHRAGRQPGGGVLPADRSFDRGNSLGADRVDRVGNLSLLAADDDLACLAGGANLSGRGIALRVALTL